MYEDARRSRREPRYGTLADIDPSRHVDTRGQGNAASVRGSTYGHSPRQIAIKKIAPLIDKGHTAGDEGMFESHEFRKQKAR